MFSISSSSCCCVRLAVPYSMCQQAVSRRPLVRSAWESVYLKGQVLEEVCGAICLCCLGSRTGINPHANGGGLGVGRMLGGDGETILEGGSLGLDGRSNGGRKGAPQWGRGERPPGKALVEVESKSPRGHRERVGDVPIAWTRSR